MQVNVAVVGIDFNIVAGRYIRACGGRRSVIGFVDADRAIDVRNGNTGFNIDCRTCADTDINGCTLVGGSIG